MKYRRALPCLFAFLSFAAVNALAQSTSATLSGLITDPAGRLVTGAAVLIADAATGQHYSLRTNGDGIYSISTLSPGQYIIQVSKIGFRTLIKPEITLNVQSAVVLNFTLSVGSQSESVTVEAGASQVNASDASVSTVIDRTFVENTPLNGRSFQGLILLTPGTITNSPQNPSGLGQSGEFSVNGQRTESNSYLVDGVSANFGASGNVVGAAPSGSLPAATALGTTQALVPVDALQEFRVQSSTYSAEYGRTPGGQFSMVTRSGTNEFHGSVFEYFRNDALDANSWFNDNTVPVTPKSAQRQNDFGGTFGGPVLFPHLFDGRNRSFFFFSYEGLRLTQPQDVAINYVPDQALRLAAPAPLSNVLNAFPLPTPNAPDLGNGLSEYVAGWSTPSRLDSTGIRVDQAIGARNRLFLRYSQTPSNTAARGNSETGSAAAYSSPSVVTTSSYAPRTFTLGLTSDLPGRVSNDLRLNLSTNVIHSVVSLSPIGGSQSVDLGQLQGIDTASVYNVLVSLFIGDADLAIEQGSSSSSQRQYNFVDSLSMTRGKHSLKFGVDWRRLTPSINPGDFADYIYESAVSVASNAVDYGFGTSRAANYPAYLNFSAFAQDEWHVAPRLSLSLGVRWDVNPAPGVTRGLKPYTAEGLNDLSTLTLAPQGTSLWKTAWYNFGPRFGFAYVANSQPSTELVLRGGGGVFFDTGQQTGSYGFNGPGFSAYNFFGSLYGVPASFPVSPTTVNPTITTPPAPPYGLFYANPTHLQSPYSYQWNGSLEQALGRSQSATLSYVGSNSRKLLEQADIDPSQINPNFSSGIYLFENGLTSSYNSLQLKYQRQISRGLQVLAAYTWSHSLDFGSYNAALPYQRGNSDNDVRHSATGALSYDLPPSGDSVISRTLLNGWGFDGHAITRSGFPVTLNGYTVLAPTTGEVYFGGLSLVPGVSTYLPGHQYPGGRSINPSAFILPPSNQSGDAPRNFVRGFGAAQLDIAVRRQLKLFDKLNGQLRLEAFNILNHPNFGSIDPYFGDPQFGQATATLAQSLGVLSPLYQAGGPRSLQATLKINF